MLPRPARPPPEHPEAPLEGASWKGHLQTGLKVIETCKAYQLRRLEPEDTSRLQVKSTTLRLPLSAGLLRE